MSYIFYAVFLTALYIIIDRKWSRDTKRMVDDVKGRNGRNDA